MNNLGAKQQDIEIPTPHDGRQGFLTSAKLYNAMEQAMGKTAHRARNTASKHLQGTVPTHGTRWILSDRSLQCHDCVRDITARDVFWEEQ